MFLVSPKNTHTHSSDSCPMSHAGDALSQEALGQQFSTYDNSHDHSSGQNCATAGHGAWWYNDCKGSDLNGQYGDNQYAMGIFWWTWSTADTNWLSGADMKLRPCGICDPGLTPLFIFE